MEEQTQEYKDLVEYLLLTDKISNFSKDPSTKVGAIFLNKDGTSPRSIGYNGMPRGLDDTNETRNQRPEKYFWYEHAERNGIYNIAREVLEGHIMFSTKFPNMEGARAAVSSGIKKIVTYSINNLENSSVEDKEMYIRVSTLLSETGVELMQINKQEIDAGFSPYDIKNKEKNNVLMKKEFEMQEKCLKYLDFLQEYANKFSPDREEKNGCMILNEKTFAPIKNGFGLNAPPATLKNITEEMHKPEEKKFWFQEAEKNAVFNAIKEEFEHSTIITSWCPCINCSLANVSVGLNRVITRLPDFTKEEDIRWKESFDRSQKLYNIANVELILLDIPKPMPVITANKKNKIK